MTTWNDALVATLRIASQDFADLTVDPAGIETGDVFYLTVESRDYLAGDRPDGFLLDPPHYRVPKATGKPERVPWPEALDAMNGPDAVKVGDWSGVTE